MTKVKCFIQVKNGGAWCRREESQVQRDVQSGKAQLIERELPLSILGKTVLVNDTPFYFYPDSV